MGRLKGYSLKTILKQIFVLIKLLDIEEELYKKMFCLSGGNRRKVCMGVALLGDPLIVIIDDISKSLDPIVSNDILLGLHRFIKNTNKSLLFTTNR